MTRSLCLLLTMIAALAPAPVAAGTREGVAKWQAEDFAGAVAEWRGPAAAGDIDAQFNMGQAYKLGRGVPLDIKQAESWYRKAATSGHKPAEANLGLVMFQQGKRTEAIPFLQRAAAAGEARAQYVLGIAHFNGDIVQRDWARAYALMVRSAQAQIPQAVSGLAEMDKHIPKRERDLGLAMAKSMKGEQPTAETASREPAPAAPRRKAVAAKTTPAAARPAPARPAATATGAWRVQLGAFASPAAAEAAWNRNRSRVPALAGLTPYFSEAGKFTRLQAGGLASKAEAARVCQSATAAKIACFTVHAP